MSNLIQVPTNLFRVHQYTTSEFTERIANQEFTAATIGCSRRDIPHVGRLGISQFDASEVWMVVDGSNIFIKVIVMYFIGWFLYLRRYYLKFYR